ncbi:hypothetical protein Tco_0437828 [Tanacetum coccineum]
MRCRERESDAESLSDAWRRKPSVPHRTFDDDPASSGVTRVDIVGDIDSRESYEPSLGWGERLTGELGIGSGSGIRARGSDVEPDRRRTNRSRISRGGHGNGVRSIAVAGVEIKSAAPELKAKHQRVFRTRYGDGVESRKDRRGRVHYSETRGWGADARTSEGRGVRDGRPPRRSVRTGSTGYAIVSRWAEREECEYRHSDLAVGSGGGREVVSAAFRRGAIGLSVNSRRLGVP